MGTGTQASCTTTHPKPSMVVIVTMFVEIVKMPMKFVMKGKCEDRTEISRASRMPSGDARLQVLGVGCWVLGAGAVCAVASSVLPPSRATSVIAGSLRISTAATAGVSGRTAWMKGGSRRWVTGRHLAASCTPPQREPSLDNPALCIPVTLRGCPRQVLPRWLRRDSLMPAMALV